MFTRGNRHGLARRFQPGQSGNLSGRPKAASHLRALLEAKYGTDAATLVARLDKLSCSRTSRVALAATELLLAYHAGKPTQYHELGSDDGPAQLLVTFGGRHVAPDGQAR